MITKEILTKYNVNANWHVPEIRGLNQDENGVFTCEFMVLAYANEGAEKFLDCYRPVQNFTVSQAEKDAEVGATDKEKLQKAFMRKYTSSVLDENGEETNVFSGSNTDGDVNFVGCTF